MEEIMKRQRTPKKKVGIYCRVSTAGQEIEDQVESLPKYAKSQGWEIYDKYIDEGISGASIDARPEFQRLLLDMTAQKFNILLVEFQDRITRTDNLAERGVIMETLKRNNITLWSQNEGPTDLSDFAGQVTSTIKFIMAAEERIDIAKRTSRGRRVKMSKGIPMFAKRLWGRQIIVNKKTDKITWKIDKGKINKVRRAVKLIIEKGYGLRKAADQVNMTHTNLHKILHNTAGSTYTQRNVCKLIGVDESYTFKIPKHARILDDKTLKRVLEAIERNKTITGRKPQKPYLFSGMLRYDDHRQKAFATLTKPSGLKYYVYRGDTVRPKQPLWYIRADQLEDPIFDRIAHYLSHYTKFEEGVSGGMEKVDAKKQLENEIEGYKQELRSVENRIERVITQVEEGYLSGKKVKTRMSKLEKEETELETIIAEKQLELEQLPSAEEIKEAQLAVHNFVERKYTKKGKLIPTPDLSNEIKMMQYKRKILDLSFEDKRELLLKLFSGKGVDKRKFGIYLSKPNDDIIEFELFGNLKPDIFLVGSIDKNGYVKDLSTQEYGCPYPYKTGCQTG